MVEFKIRVRVRVKHLVVIVQVKVRSSRMHYVSECPQWSRSTRLCVFVCAACKT